MLSFPSQQLAGFLVPADGTDLQAVVAMTIGANDAPGIRFIRAALQPKLDNLGGGDIVAGVTFLARRVNAVTRIHDIGRCRVVLVVAVGVRVTVAGNAADVGRSMSAGQHLLSVVHMANKAGAVVGEQLGRCTWLIQKQRCILIHYQWQRTVRPSRKLGPQFAHSGAA